jgi:hypothetical protein
VRRAERESKFNYIEFDGRDKRSGKTRHFCYPPDRSALRTAQNAIKDRLLREIELVWEVRGYLRKSTHISAAEALCDGRYVGTLDISKFHPSINGGHVFSALRRHGVSCSLARQITRIVTYRDQLPQGASTSNHVANLVVDMLLRCWILPYAGRRGVGVRNYGDDFAFFGDNAKSVTACVRYATRKIRSLGFVVNDKGRECEHRGAQRRFLGCAVGRDRLDFPRQSYRCLRRELREMVSRERASAVTITDEKKVNSVRAKINYVNGINKRKGRRLRDELYRLYAARQKRPVAGRSDDNEIA